MGFLIILIIERISSFALLYVMNTSFLIYHASREIEIFKSVLSPIAPLC